MQDTGAIVGRWRKSALKRIRPAPAPTVHFEDVQEPLFDTLMSIWKRLQKESDLEHEPELPKVHVPGNVDRRLKMEMAMGRDPRNHIFSVMYTLPFVNRRLAQMASETGLVFSAHVAYERCRYVHRMFGGGRNAAAPDDRTLHYSNEEKRPLSFVAIHRPFPMLYDERWFMGIAPRPLLRYAGRVAKDLSQMQRVRTAILAWLCHESASPIRPGINTLSMASCGRRIDLVVHWWEIKKWKVRRRPFVFSHENPDDVERAERAERAKRGGQEEGGSQEDPPRSGAAATYAKSVLRYEALHRLAIEIEKDGPSLPVLPLPTACKPDDHPSYRRSGGDRRLASEWRHCIGQYIRGDLGECADSIVDYVAETVCTLLIMRVRNPEVGFSKCMNESCGASFYSGCRAIDAYGHRYERDPKNHALPCETRVVCDAGRAYWKPLFADSVVVSNPMVHFCCRACFDQWREPLCNVCDRLPFGDEDNVVSIMDYRGDRQLRITEAIGVAKRRNRKLHKFALKELQAHSQGHPLYRSISIDTLRRLFDNVSRAFIADTGLLAAGAGIAYHVSRREMQRYGYGGVRDLPGGTSGWRYAVQPSGTTSWTFGLKRVLQVMKGCAFESRGFLDVINDSAALDAFIQKLKVKSTPVLFG